MAFGYTQYAVYWRNPENRQYERIPIVQLVKSPSGALNVQMHVRAGTISPTSFLKPAAAGKWYTISKLWVRE